MTIDKDTIEKVIKAFDDNHCPNPTYIFMNEPMGQALEWDKEEWWEGSGYYGLGGDHPVFINDGMIDE